MRLILEKKIPSRNCHTCRQRCVTQDNLYLIHQIKYTRNHSATNRLYISVLDETGEAGSEISKSVRVIFIQLTNMFHRKEKQIGAWFLSGFVFRIFDCRNLRSFLVDEYFTWHNPQLWRLYSVPMSPVWL